VLVATVAVGRQVVALHHLKLPADILAEGSGSPTRPAPAGAEELELLVTAPDAEVAARVGRTALAVTVLRNRRGIPAPWGWTEEQIALSGTLPDAEVARLVGRAVGAVIQKRSQRGLPNPFDGRREE
jgi:hypothetical protein